MGNERRTGSLPAFFYSFLPHSAIASHRVESSCHFGHRWSTSYRQSTRLFPSVSRLPRRIGQKSKSFTGHPRIVRVDVDTVLPGCFKYANSIPVNVSMTLVNPEKPGGHSTEPDIEFRNVSLTYGSQVVLDNVSFTIHQGEPVALLGPSGTSSWCFHSILTGLAPRRYAKQFRISWSDANQP